MNRTKKQLFTAASLAAAITALALFGGCETRTEPEAETRTTWAAAEQIFSATENAANINGVVRFEKTDIDQGTITNGKLTLSLLNEMPDSVFQHDEPAGERAVNNTPTQTAFWPRKLEVYDSENTNIGYLVYGTEDLAASFLYSKTPQTIDIPVGSETPVEFEAKRGWNLIVQDFVANTLLDSLPDDIQWVFNKPK